MVLNFSCPNCGADMAYDIRRGQLHCDHCDHSEPVTEDKAEWMTGAPSPEDAPKKLACPNCGGVVQAGDKACAEECEAKYSKRSANYDADRMNLGLENIPADIRFNFVKK